MKKRSDGRYSRSIVTGYDLNGKQQRKVFYAKTKWELDKKVSEWKELHEKGLDLERDMTINELLRQWLDYKSGTVKEQSLVSFESIAKQLSKELGQKMVTKLTVTDLTRLRSKLVSENRQKTFNRFLSILRQVLSYAMRQNIVITNVAKKIDPLKTTKNERRAFTDDERQIILNADIPLSDKAFIYTLFYTGLRRGEALALTANDVDLKKRRIKVHSTFVPTIHTMQEGTKSIAGMRTVPMSDELYEVLAPYIDELGEGFLFTSVSGCRLAGRTWARFWQRIMISIFGEDYPEDITPHVFRHNYCSDLCKAGVPVRTAMYLMGHSSMRMTMEIYSHVNFEDVDISLLNEYYARRESNRESKVKKTT